MGKRIDSIWDCYVTVHMTLREDIDYTPMELAKDSGVYKSRIVQQLIITHPDFISKMDELRSEGFFV